MITTAPRVEIGKVAEFVNGMAFKPSDWESAGRPIIRIQNLTDPEKPFNHTTREVKAKYVVEPGELLMSWSASLGVFEWNGPQAVLNQHIFRVRPNPSRVDRAYFKHALERALELMEPYLHGSTMKHVNRGEFRGTRVLLPSLDEQRRIAAILDKADAIRRKRREAIALTEELLRSTFLEMFGDPVTNAKGWPSYEMGKVAKFKAGGTLPSGEAFDDQEGGFLLLKVAELNMPPNIPAVRVSREWTAVEGPRSATCSAGAVVLPKRGGAISTNKKRLLARPAVLDPNLMGVEPGAKLTSAFLHSWFEMFDLNTISSGSTVPQLNKKDLAPLTMHVPPMVEQRKYADVASRLDAHREQHLEAMTQSDALFHSLVQRAFRGEL